MESADRLDQLREYGRMQWLDAAQAWRAEPDEVLRALAAEGFEEYKREIARTPGSGAGSGGVWQGLDHRTGAVASTIWVREPTTTATLVYITINGHPLRGG
jgi:hypothetical protein